MEKESFFEEVVKFRNTFKISQEDLAKEVGISQSMLSRFEQGENVRLSEDELEKLKYVINTYRKENSLNAMIDWIKVTVKENDPIEVCQKYLNMKFDYFQKTVGRHHYVARYEYSSITIYEPSKDVKYGCMIEMSGQGCRYFEKMLDEQGMTLIDWLGFISKHAENFPRIDLAVDDYIEYFSIPVLLDKIERGEYLTEFKSIVPKYEYGDRKNKYSKGLTIYFGKRTSKLHFCFYQKNFEISKKHGIPLEEIEVKNRYELRVCDDYAIDIVKQLVEWEEVLPVAMGLIKKKLVIVQRLKHKISPETLRATFKKGKIKIWKPWKQLMYDVDTIRIESKAIEDDYVRLSRREDYLKKQAMASVLLIKDIDEALGTNILENIIEEVRKKENSRNEHLLKVATTQLKDVILKNNGFLVNDIESDVEDD